MSDRLPTPRCFCRPTPAWLPAALLVACALVVGAAVLALDTLGGRLRILPPELAGVLPGGTTALQGTGLAFFAVCLAFPFVALAWVRRRYGHAIFGLGAVKLVPPEAELFWLRAPCRPDRCGSGLKRVVTFSLADVVWRRSAHGVLVWHARAWLPTRVLCPLLIPLRSEEEVGELLRLLEPSPEELVGRLLSLLEAAGEAAGLDDPAGLPGRSAEETEPGTYREPGATMGAEETEPGAR